MIINGLTIITGKNIFNNADMILCECDKLGEEGYKIIDIDTQHDIHTREHDYITKKLLSFFEVKDLTYNDFVYRYKMYSHIVFSLFSATYPAENPENEIILLRCPEIHLHPAFHRKIIDYLVEKININNYKFIVETYSGHIFNALRVNIKAGNIGLEKVSAYNIENYRVESIGFIADGKLAYWPKAFFDQNMYDYAILSKK
jgi:hypothetical protein